MTLCARRVSSARSSGGSSTSTSPAKRISWVAALGIDSIGTATVMLPSSAGSAPASAIAFSNRVAERSANRAYQ